MTNEILETATELKKIIDITDKALGNAYKLKASIDNIHPDRKYYDGLYGMHIGKHSDNSGISINLCRTTGNEKLLDVIICELERQLKLFKEEYEAL